MAAPLATEEILRKFLDRIEEDLERHPVELDPADHRLQFASVLGRCGAGTHYELLEIDPDAEPDAVHAAYQRVARIVHPVHSERVGLAGRSGVAELLFERATEAYLVLGDPHRRSRYDRDAAVDRWRPELDRQDEARRVALELLERARELVERDDYHDALALLQQAVRADPESAPCWALMGRCRAQNPKWLHMASDSLRRALGIERESTEYRLALAEIEEERGRCDEARRLFQEILDRAPGNAAARDGLERLEGAGDDGGSTDKRRWWGR